MGSMQRGLLASGGVAGVKGLATETQQPRQQQFEISEQPDNR